MVRHPQVEFVTGESIIVCANQAQKGFTTMTNAEATITENAATVAEQGAHVAPETSSTGQVRRTTGSIG
jgi:hypothetical protein